VIQVSGRRWSLSAPCRRRLPRRRSPLRRRPLVAPRA
jgi:hypothetical protein